MCKEQRDNQHHVIDEFEPPLATSHDCRDDRLIAEVPESHKLNIQTIASICHTQADPER
jgi:hypothetical protein